MWLCISGSQPSRSYRRHNRFVRGEMRRDPTSRAQIDAVTDCDSVWSIVYRIGRLFSKSSPLLRCHALSIYVADAPPKALTSAPIRKGKANWLPAVDFRGEGILLEIDEVRVRSWESRAEVRASEERHHKVERAWHRSRGLDFESGRPIRYTMLHTLSHLLLRQFALDCGYSSASLRERIYCAAGETGMAGILIYTATPELRRLPRWSRRARSTR